MRVQQKLPSHRKSSEWSKRRKSKRLFQVLLVSISEDNHFWLANSYFRGWVRTLSYYEEESQKYSISPPKSPKIELFLPRTHQKNFWWPKIWNKIDREPVVVFIRKSDECDQYVPRKIEIERWNAEGWHGGKKTFEPVLVRIGFAPLAWKNLHCKESDITNSLKKV